MALKPKIIATIEARMTSSRLPGKILKKIVGRPVLELMIERLSKVPSLDGIVIATTVNETDDPVIELAEKLGVGFYRGSEDDVLVRVLETAKSYKADIIVETTGDCPLIDPELVEICIKGYLNSNVDYVSNIIERTYPIGMDTQVFSTNVLADVARRTDDPADHEHVSLYIYRHPEIYSLKNMPGSLELTDPELGLTLDTAEDFDLIREIFERLYPKNPSFGLSDILQLLKSNPELCLINDQIKRKHA